MNTKLVALIGTILTLATTRILAHDEIINRSAANTLAAQGIPQKAIEQALKAYQKAIAKGVVRKPVITLIDFAKPSNQKRMWIIDMRSQKVVFNGLVSQGANSGMLYARHFSNTLNSHESSLGAMVTGVAYHGKHGLSVRLHGLQKNNSNVFKRAVVFHTANYATPSFVKKYGRLGHSWGCFAINPAKGTAVMQKIKDGSFVYAYAPPNQHGDFLITKVTL